ncbi:PDR/VanB family oxidoreductase [Sporichthya brevicatena]|uniref:PDR/VanB family oxidoreductase n=1 Tax=Sporichthya brevicatena TaxID=171442 RepID=A0ABP3SGK3_9ACTN
MTVAPDYQQVVVAERVELAQGVVGLTLHAVDSAPLAPWTPGAHIDIRLPSGLIRQYSLCGDPQDRQAYRIAVLRAPDSRGGSVEVHERCAVGDELAVSVPRNHFPLEAARRHLFIAGGIGITPLLPMVRQLAAAGGDWELLYGGRSRSSMAFLDKLDGPVDVVPEDEFGLLPLDAFLEKAGSGDLVYCCGPEALLAAVEARCAHLLEPGALRVERFSGAGAGARQDDPTANEAFEVVLNRRGVVVEIPPARSVLEVLREIDPELPFSCEEGYCGTCETAVLAGTPDHRDTLLTPEERADGSSMMICVSRALTPRLTLDL